jgi:hypothetical protein
MKFNNDEMLLSKLGIPIKKSLHSPLREDRHRSFSIFRDYNGKLRWKDFGTGEHGSIPELYRLLEGVDLSNRYRYKDENNNLNYLIDIKEKEYSDNDLSYWNNYCVDLDILNLYKVKSLKYYKYKDKVIYNNLYMFSIRYGEGIYKIYMPGSRFKFFHNCNSKDVFGYNQLNNRDKRVIITKSFKDVLVLRVLGYNSISVMAETINPNSIEFYMNIFRNNGWEVYLLFDNDKAGIKAIIDWLEYYKDMNMLILDKHKDISDYIYYRGYNETREYLNYFIKNVN